MALAGAESRNLLCRYYNYEGRLPQTASLVKSIQRMVRVCEKVSRMHRLPLVVSLQDQAVDPHANSCRPVIYVRIVHVYAAIISSRRLYRQF